MIPRVTAIQSMVRVFYEDGTIAVVTVRPDNIAVDPMQPEIPVDAAELQSVVATHLQVVQEHIGQQSPDAIYKYAKKSAALRVQLQLPQVTIPSTNQSDTAPADADGDNERCSGCCSGKEACRSQSDASTTGAQAD